MKQIRLFSLVFTLYYTGAWAQDKYYPLVEEGKEWVIYNDYYMDDYETPLEEREPYRTYTITGDTIIQGKSYKKLYAMCERVFGDKDVHYFCALREEERKRLCTGNGRGEFFYLLYRGDIVPRNGWKSNQNEDR